MATLIIKWARPTYTGHSHTEIWRAGSQLADTLAATVEAGATQLDDTASQLYADTTVTRGTTYWYYVRHVNTAGTEGSFAEIEADADLITIAEIDGLGSLAEQDTINNNDWSGADLAVANGGTGASSASAARTNLGLGSMATQNAASASITGGTIDGTTIGGSTPAEGTFSTLTASSELIVPSDPPASASDTGVAGTITRDTDYLYVCVATDTWKRVAIATW